MKKVKKVIYWIATLWLALGMVSTGVAQVRHASLGPGAAEMMQHLGFPLYLLAFIGVAKIVGSVAVLLPRTPLLKEWAYAGFFFLMAGALYAHMSVHDPGIEWLPALLLLILTLASWALRPDSRQFTAA